MDCHFATRTVESIEDWDVRCAAIEKLDFSDMLREVYPKKAKMCERRGSVTRIQKRRQGSGKSTTIAPRRRPASQEKLGRCHQTAQAAVLSPVQHAPTTPGNGVAQLPQRKADAGKRHDASSASGPPLSAIDWTGQLKSSLLQLRGLYDKMETPAVPTRGFLVSSPYAKDLTGLNAATMASRAMQSAAGYAPSAPGYDEGSYFDSDSEYSADSEMSDNSPPTPV